MGNLTTDMSRLVDEIQTMSESRANFIKETQDTVKQQADETRRFITNFRNEMAPMKPSLEKNLSQETGNSAVFS